MTSKIVYNFNVEIAIDMAVAIVVVIILVVLTAVVASLVAADVAFVIAADPLVHAVMSQTELKNFEYLKELILPQDDAPFVIIDNNESLPMEKRFTGFCMDIVRELAKKDKMNFNFTIQIEDGTGNWQDNASRWSGIIGQLIAQVGSLAFHVICTGFPILCLFFTLIFSFYHEFH